MSKSNKTRVPVHTLKTKAMKPFGFDIIVLGASGNEYDSSVLHRHTFFELFVFTSGKGSHDIDFDSYSIKRNSVHFVSPGQIHKLKAVSAKGFVICFSDEFMSLETTVPITEKFPFLSDGRCAVVLSARDGLQIIDIATTIFHSRNQLILLPELFRHYLSILLLKLKILLDDAPKNNTSSSQKKKVHLFKKLIDENFLMHLQIADYAGKLHITPNHLNAICKQHEGKSALQLVQQRVILEGKRLLYATDLTVKEIAFALNFENTAYFNRFFKKNSGYTPLSYRKALQQNR